MDLDNFFTRSETAEVPEGVDKVDINDGLHSYQLVPKNEGKAVLKGAELLDHMTKFLYRNLGCDKDAAVSSHMDVMISKDQEKVVLNPSLEDFTARELALTAVGEGAKKKLAKRKMDMLGAVKSHSGPINSEKKMKALKSKLELAQSMAAINVARAAEKEKKTKEDLEDARKAAPKAVEKLRKIGTEYNKLTVGQMNAILMWHYRKTKAVKGKKSAVLAEFKKEYENDPEAINAINHSHPPIAPAATDPNDDMVVGEELDAVVL